MPQKPTKNTPVREWVERHNPTALLMTGFDECIIGMCHQFGRPPVVAYGLTRVINKLMEDGMTEDEARDYWAFSQAGAWAGEDTPVFVEIMGKGI